MTRFKKSFFAIILFHLSIIMQGQVSNASYLYDLRSEVCFDHSTLLSGDSISIFLKLSLEDDLGAHFLEYTLRSNESTDNAQPVKVKTRVLANTDNDYVLALTLKNPQIPAILKVNVLKQNNHKKYEYDIGLNQKSDFRTVNFSVLDKNELPINKRFILNTDSISILSPDGNNRFYAFHYNYDFPAAKAPMMIKRRAQSKSLLIDTTFNIKANEKIALPKPGLYFIQSDTSGLLGISFLVKEAPYPRHVRINELIGQVVYVSTSDEFSRLQRKENKKKAFDDYWRKMTNSEPIAKSIIRNYYKRITEANILFTNYKEGWKTDKGMVYTILGPPDEVLISIDEELWIYHKSEKKNEFKFTFRKVKNIFSDQHYELIRNPGYKKLWYEKIRLWRSGISIR